MKIKARFILPLATALACAVGALGCNASQAPVEIAQLPPPAGSDVLALVAPLAPGATLGEAKVLEISAVQRGVIGLVVELEGEKVELEIARRGGTAEPPASSGEYAVYYSLRRTALLGDRDAAELTRALAKVLDKNASAPLPAGLTSHSDPG